MSRRRFKPSSPQEIEDRRAKERADERARRDDPARWGETPVSAGRRAELEAQGAEMRVDGRGCVISARKNDVFDELFHRGSIARDGLEAVRRLEKDMTLRAGLGGRAANYVFVDRGGDAAGITDRQVDAGARVDDALELVGPPASRILATLLDPLAERGPHIDWRAIVERETGEANPHAQGAALRMAVKTLAEVYTLVDKREIDRKKARRDRMDDAAAERFARGDRAMS